MKKFISFSSLIFMLFTVITGCLNTLIYYPDKKIAQTPADRGLDFKSISLTRSDGMQLAAWWIPATEGRGTVLFCHGNAGNISNRLESITVFHHLKLHVLIFDYSGYGRSSGSPSERDTYRDVEAAWQHLRNQHIEPSRIIVFGRSLGGAIATWLAHEHTPGMLIIESTFTSVADAAAHLTSCCAAGILFGNTYPTCRLIKNVRCPVLLIHSPEDELIPFEQGERLFQCAREPKAFLRIHGSHNSGFLESAELYRKGLSDFINRYLQ